MPKIRGINQGKLIQTLMKAAAGDKTITSEQLGAARALLDKVVPGASRAEDDAEAARSTHYVEFRLVIVDPRSGAGGGTESAPAAAPGGGDPKP